MGHTVWGTSRHEYIHGYNQSGDTLRLSWKDVPPYISLGASSLDIAPGDLFTLSAYMNTRDGAEIGSLDIPFILMADYGGEHREIPVHVTARHSAGHHPHTPSSNSGTRHPPRSSPP